MNGKEEMLFQYLEGASKRFIIPVYQRNYDWQNEQCKQLFDDLIKLNKSGTNHHFFGSIVSGHNTNSGMQEFLVIDGQQRLTTVSLLLLAMYNLLDEGKLESNIPRLKDKILEQYLIDKYEEETRMKLKPIKDDSKAFGNLLEDENDYIKASNITINYKYFYNRIQMKEISIDKLYESFCKLQIINIFLGPEDNPQLIFESLNSTGMDLSEGDKIRNYILMGLSPVKLQEQYYDKYWYRIEKLTNYDVSMFVRDYLSIKLQATPAMKKIYFIFKEYMEDKPFDTKEKLLEDLLSYARRYENLLRANTGVSELDASIDRLNRYEATVTRPFLMEVLKLAEKNEDGVCISENELVEIFELVESYIFRRQICDLPTNSLNKIFVALNNEIKRYDGTTSSYLEKFKYALSRKTASASYPDDLMFAGAMRNKQIYLMQSKNKKYLLERYENWGTLEIKDVWTLISDGKYTIEHIMPQTLQNDWRDALGEDYESIHEEWVHRLGNLTLTAYNSKYSNNTFDKKKTIKNGFNDSGIRMNQKLANYEKWTLDELVERNEAMVMRGLKIWPMVKTSYKPIRKSLDSVTLADDYILKGRKIARYSFKGEEKSVSTWSEMYYNVMSTLHRGDSLILLQLAADKTNKDLSAFVSEAKGDSHQYAELEEGIYLWTNTSTESKISLLRRFFKVFEIEEESLVFYLQDESMNTEEFDENTARRKIIRKKFWEFTLPQLRDKTNRFLNVNPSTSNYQSTYLGLSGIRISVVGNLDHLKAELNIATSDPKLNDKIFEYLESRKVEIEKSSKTNYSWVNKPQNRIGKIVIENPSFGIENEQLWDESVDFLAQGVNTIAKHIVPLVEEFYEEKF